MQKIPINLAQPGMVLEKPAVKENGQVLLAAGATLTEGIISQLEKKGIKTIVVQGEPLDMEGLTSNPSFEKRAERLEHLFRYYQNDPVMQKIKKFLQYYFRQKALISAGGQKDS